MVLVCGGTQSGRLPQTLCRPPEIGSSRLAARESRVSKTGSTPGTLCARGPSSGPAPVVEEAGIGQREQGAEHRVLLVAGAAMV